MSAFLYEVIIVAAGTGQRMNLQYNKLLYKLSGETIIERTIKAFVTDGNCNKVIIVAKNIDMKKMQGLIGFNQEKLRWIEGADTRQASVNCGLKAITESCQYVLVHDGARPFVKKEYFQKLIQAASSCKSGSVLAVKMKDTVKIGKDGVVQTTLDRSNLWAVQTPQAFCTAILKKAHERAINENLVGYDDATLVEKLGTPVVIVEGDYENIKITTQTDLIVAESVCRLRG